MATAPGSKTLRSSSTVTTDPLVSSRSHVRAPLMRTRSPRRSPPGGLDGIDDGAVARASAQDPRQHLPDGLPVRVVLGIHAADGHQEPGRAEPALEAVMFLERLLEGVQPLLGGNALDGGDPASVRLNREHDARADRLAVEQDGA